MGCTVFEPFLKFNQLPAAKKNSKAVHPNKHLALLILIEL
jgi:hypothetical protein